MTERGTKLGVTSTVHTQLKANMSVTGLTQQYFDDLWDLRDPRMDSYPLMSSPWPTIGLCLAYVLFVKVVGPAFMKNREAFDLKTPMMIYNVFQVIFSSYVIYLGLLGGWGGAYSFRCQPVDYSHAPSALTMAHVTWLYFVGKFVEFLDTVFFVLRKKQAHVTFLHLSHHVIMALYMWPCVRFMPGGHGSLAGILNAGIHVLMYSYYLLAALGPRVRPWLWWKRYLTVAQMAQFVVVAAHSLQLLFVEPCGYPVAYAYFVLALMAFFLALFANFYVQAYINKTASRHGVGNGTVINRESKHD